MAALSDRYDSPVVELRKVAAEDLNSILEEETGDWRAGLNWDFRPSADLVRRFVHMQALGGFALMANCAGGSRLVGYSYFVCEESKGLIGDLFMMREYRTLENETALLNAVLGAMWHTPGIRRIESQIMLLSSPMERDVPYQKWFRAHPRQFLEIPLASMLALLPRTFPKIRIAPWTEPWQRSDRASDRPFVSRPHRQPDQRSIPLDRRSPPLPDQHRPVPGMRYFLRPRVLCRDRCRPAVSCTAYPCRAWSLPMSGTSLRYAWTRRIAAPASATNWCVASLVALAAHGCRTVSLTVTAANESALQLYQRMGFVPRREFAAYVWERR